MPRAMSGPGFPITDGHPIAFGAPLPERVETVVIGAGIIGTIAAWELAKQGIPVLLLEKGRVAAEQSSRNWGWIRAQGRDLDELPILLEAQRLWPQIAAAVDTDIGLKQVGVTYLARTEAELATYEAWLQSAKALGVSSHMLSQTATAAMFDQAARRWCGALHTPTDMKAEPWVTVPAIARAAAKDGVLIRESCAVRCLDLAAGRVAGVVTEAGRVGCTNVILAGGAWSSLFLRRHGIAIPQLSVRSNVLATGALPDVHPGAAVEKGLAFRRRADGGYTLAPGGFAELFVGPDAVRALPKYWTQLKADPLGVRLWPFAPKGFPDAWGTRRHWGEGRSPFEAMRILNPKVNSKRISKLLHDFKVLFPSLGMIPVQATWAGMIDTMPDVVPVVDTCPDLPGLTIATGMSGHGFGIGPGFGRIAAALSQGRDTGHDLTRFRFDRFRDGSPMRPGPGL